MKSKLLVTVCSAALMVAAGAAANASRATAGEVSEAAAARQALHSMQPVATRIVEAPKQRKFRREKGLTGTHSYIVRLADDPLATYRGGIPGLAATNPDQLRLNAKSVRGAGAAAGGPVKLDVTSPASVAYLDYLGRRQAAFEASLSRRFGALDITHRYKHAFNGMTVRMTQEQAAAVAAMPEVEFVQRDFTRKLTLQDSVELIDAPSLWDGSASGGVPVRGEGMVIGVLDTGINTDHPAFAAVSPGDGYVHENPLGEGVYLHDCAPFDAVVNPNGGQPELCNSKLIGHKIFPATQSNLGQDNAEDWNGHGSHTSSTAAGNVVLDVPFVDTAGAPTGIMFEKVHGVAPRANVVHYGVCGTQGCPGADLVAAIDQATADRVDAINYSIGGGPSNPWNDADSQAFLAARDAGIYVATSAANDGPGLGTVGSPADSPWLTSVAASTHQRTFTEKLVTGLNGGATAAPADMPGRSATGAYGPAPMVYAGDYGDGLCNLGAFPPNTFNGEIVLCDRGAIALVDKADSVAQGGAGGIIIATTATSSQTLFNLPYSIPGIQIAQEHGDPLREWLSTGSGHAGEITAASPTIDFDAADAVAGFSSRGPNVNVPKILSPSVSGPGVDIYAAFHSPIEYGQISGTSMSGPHVAGAGTLLRQLHPDWTPAEVHSALATTGIRDMTAEETGEPATPFHYGGGRIDVAAAANAGLVLHETTANFEAANPALDGDPSALNLPSMATDECLQTCTFTRTVRATASGTWTFSAEGDTGLGVEVSPSSFSLSEGQTQELTITADVQRLDVGEWYFGWVVLTPDNPAISTTRMPVAVVPTAGIVPESLDVKVRRDAGSVMVGGFRTGEIAGLQIDSYTLRDVDERLVSIAGDNGGQFSPFTGTGTAIEFYDVPAGTPWFIARTTASTSPDVDLFVGQDLNLDGDISEDELLCESGNPAEIEECQLTEGLDAGGRFWVAVINFTASDEPVDDTTLEVTWAEASDGSLGAEAPASIVAGEGWMVRLYWDREMDFGDVFQGAITVEGIDGRIATVPVSIERIEDDVRAAASATDVTVDDVIDMTLEVEANLTPEDAIYVVDAEIPEGFELVPGSLAASEGDVYVINNMVIWFLENPSLFEAPRNYVSSVNGPNVRSDHPLYDASCDTGFGGYIDLESFGLDAEPGLAGDDITFVTFEGQNLPFYGDPREGIAFTDDGFGALMSGSAVPDLGATPWMNTDLPDAAEPNDIVALAWKDLEIVYDADANSGVTTSAPGANLSVIEFDDVQPFPAGSTGNRLDFEMVFNGIVDDSPGAYEIVYAYDNVVGDWSDATIGMENADGSLGSQFVGEISDGLMICHDYVGPSLDPKTVTYQLKVTPAAAGQQVRNDVFSITDNPGSREAMTSVSFSVTGGDFDSDGVTDEMDNCSEVANPAQIDADSDGYGNACDGDFNQDDIVNYADLGYLRSQSGSSDPVADLNADGTVDSADLDMFRSMFFQRPGPSGLVR